ncbi:MAG: DNA phosphorothioation system sulfurtransferase DndC [Methylococcaceae bacterium]|nr:MAG: DNA phosphorothioation system sulfurtransferase DndC [Methylococcaceae bacterium]
MPATTNPVHHLPTSLSEFHVQRSQKLLQDNFLADSRPWVVAYSGGKDSTLVLQLVYEMLLDLPVQRLKPVYVIASDTRVEVPAIEAYLAERIQTLTAHAAHSGLPLYPRLVTPGPEQDFWYNLIGKGYPPPTRWFRWCTSKMKIKPVKASIENIITEYGSVILLLGTRSDESQSRGRRMNARELSSRQLNPHQEIPNALVLSPIADWTSDQVWEYLYSNTPPWGGNHDFMLNLYRQANGGECPVVMDLNTPSCGGSRFGCWTCTVVKTDKSMESFIENGEAWMAPLNRYRNWLKDIREDETRRSPYRRGEEGKRGEHWREGLGPFIASTRLELLVKLLETERAADYRLISDENINTIQACWTKEFDVSDSAYLIAEKYGREPWKRLHKP